jgi:hypothetical protein
MRSTWRKVGLFWILCACSFITVTLCLHSYSVAISSFGDSVSYLSVAKAIASWHFEGLQVMQFWGVSYAIAFVALLGHLPLTVALIIVSTGSSAAVAVLSGRLWGWYVAVFTTAVSFDWMQRSMLGGSEPFFLLLLLTAFLAIRRGHWWIAALLASFATTVRPLGICALIAIGLVLLYHKQYRLFCSALLTGVLVGLLYVLPLHIYLHDSMATIHSYETARPLFGVPFYAILQGLFLPRPLTNLVLSCCWVVFIVTGIGLLSFSRSCLEFRRKQPSEFLFAVLYTLIISCYNYPHWALGSFARFAIPVIPFAFLACQEFLASHNLIPERGVRQLEPIVWTCGVIFPVLAAFSAYGIRNLIR